MLQYSVRFDIYMKTDHNLDASRLAISLSIYIYAVDRSRSIVKYIETIE